MPAWLSNRVCLVVVGLTSAAGCSLDLPEPVTQTPESAQSCAQLLASGQTESGIYEVTGPQGPVSLYCEMEQAGGGWTLIGRSVEDGVATGFGWGEAGGDVNDDASAYSLDAFGHLPPPYAELLAVAHDGTSKAFASTAYRVTLPADFAETCGDRACATVEVEAAAGSGCPEEDAAPFALSFVGHTDESGQFYAHEDDQFETWMGLRPEQFDLGGAATCLNHAQAMLFVR